MAQHHTDPARETDIHALPDLEVFYLSHDEARQHAHCGDEPRDDDDPENLAGWYYWWGLPGCLPDSDLYGPFASEQAAVRDARDARENAG